MRIAFGLNDLDGLGLHHDISTMTGEAIIFFALAESPLYGQVKNNCLALLRNTDYAVVLMAVRIPVLNGFFLAFRHM